jgi:hypothetical protein
VYYTDGVGEPIVWYASESEEWVTAVVRLAPGKIVGSFMVGLDDFTKDSEGSLSAYFDYVMLAGTTSSGFGS